MTKARQPPRPKKIKKVLLMHTPTVSPIASIWSACPLMPVSGRPTFLRGICHEFLNDLSELYDYSWCNTCQQDGVMSSFVSASKKAAFMVMKSDEWWSAQYHTMHRRRWEREKRCLKAWHNFTKFCGLYLKGYQQKFCGRDSLRDRCCEHVYNICKISTANIAQKVF